MDKKSEREEKNEKVALCNEEKSDSYKGLAKVYGAGEGSDVRITENINYDTSLDACKGLPTLEVGKIRLMKAVWQVIILEAKPRNIIKQR